MRYLAPPFDIEARFEGDEPDLHRHGFAGCQCFVERNVFWAASSEGEPAAEDYLEGRAHGVFTFWGCRFIEANFERMMHQGYGREELIADLRAYLSSLGYAQSAELSAPDELRVLAPFTRDARAWVGEGGPGPRVRVGAAAAREAGRAPPPRPRRPSRGGAERAGRSRPRRLRRRRGALEHELAVAADRLGDD